MRHLGWLLVSSRWTCNFSSTMVDKRYRMKCVTSSSGGRYTCYHDSPHNKMIPRDPVRPGDATEIECRRQPSATGARRHRHGWGTSSRDTVWLNHTVTVFAWSGTITERHRDPGVTCRVSPGWRGHGTVVVATWLSSQASVHWSGHER